MQALDLNLPGGPLVYSTDAYMTSICCIGSKSLSHVLSCIERCKDRLLATGPASAAARTQIISSVMQYWEYQPGIGVNIVDKLLNYTILSPASVVDWALGKKGENLSKACVYEMVSITVGKVTSRVRQLVKSKDASDISPEQKAIIQETVERERKGMKDLFTLMEDLLVSWAAGSKDEALENGNGNSDEVKMIMQWGKRWLRVFRRKAGVEGAWLLEAEIEKLVVEGGDMGVDADPLHGVE